jgi:hypothetical protein
MPLVPEDLSREEERGDVRNTSDAGALEGGDTAAVLEVGSSDPMTEFKLTYMPIR